MKAPGLNGCQSLDARPVSSTGLIWCRGRLESATFNLSLAFVVRSSAFQGKSDLVVSRSDSNVGNFPFSDQSPLSRHGWSVVGCVTDWHQETRSLFHVGDDLSAGLIYLLLISCLLPLARQQSARRNGQSFRDFLDKWTVVSVVH
jgi:hypothetical protein